MSFIKKHKAEVFIASFMIWIVGFALGCIFTGSGSNGRQMARTRFERSSDGRDSDRLNPPNGNDSDDDFQDGMNRRGGRPGMPYDGNMERPGRPGCPGNGQAPDQEVKPDDNQAPDQSTESQDKKEDSNPDQNTEKNNGTSQPDDTTKQNPDNSTTQDKTTQPENNSTNPII